MTNYENPNHRPLFLAKVVVNSGFPDLIKKVVHSSTQGFVSLHLLITSSKSTKSQQKVNNKSTKSQQKANKKPPPPPPPPPATTTTGILHLQGTQQHTFHSAAHRFGRPANGNARTAEAT
jgi:hypothetical protein